ncbi:MAG: MCE family protein [Candidatus Omnitrophica bacterium]|nr:MCE family protein [Candidatus Omnitrophota bacterium]
MVNNLWDRNKSIRYVKIGSFFLIAFILFFITILSIRKFSIGVFKGSYNIVVKFNFVEGLRPASPVRFCGVDVGEIKKVVVKEEYSKPKVYVHASIQSGVKIPQDSQFFINSLSLFGEKYLEITPPLVILSYVVSNETVAGVSPVPLFQIFANFNQTVNEISTLVKDGPIKTSLENTIANIESISLDLKNIMSDLRDKRGTIGRLLYDETLYNSTEEFIRDLKAHPWKLLHKPKENQE